MARLYVSEETHQRVKVLAASAGVSMQEWVESRLVGDSRSVVPAKEATVPPPVVRLPEEPRTQPVAKVSPFEARAAKRSATPTLKTNEFGDVIYDD